MTDKDSTRPITPAVPDAAQPPPEVETADQEGTKPGAPADVKPAVPPERADQPATLGSAGETETRAVSGAPGKADGTPDVLDGADGLNDATPESEDDAPVAAGARPSVDPAGDEAEPVEEVPAEEVPAEDVTDSVEQQADEPEAGPAAATEAAVPEAPSETTPEVEERSTESEPAAQPRDDATSEPAAAEHDEAATKPDTEPAPTPAKAPEAGEPEGTAARSRLVPQHFWGASPAGLLIGLLLALLGFGLVVQLQSNTGSGLVSRRQDDLVRILDDLSSREDRLRQQIAGLQETRNRLSTGGDNSTAALEEARRRASELGILAGTIAAQGSGIEMTITDPHRKVTAEDMLDAIEELRGAGAEAISVGPARIGLSSAFTQDTPTSPIVVDGISLTAPYVILVIGDPSTLATAMNIPGGVIDTVRGREAETQIVQQQRLIIRALREVRAPQYAQPSPTPS
jgi:uncharacterized protein YlxW (UPF0749 family)